MIVECWIVWDVDIPVVHFEYITLMEMKRFSANLSKISQAFCCHYGKSEEVANKNIILASSLKEGFTVAILHSVWKPDPVLQHWIEGSSQRKFVCPVITCYCCMTGEVDWEATEPGTIKLLVLLVPQAFVAAYKQNNYLIHQPFLCHLWHLLLPALQYRRC